MPPNPDKIVISDTACLIGLANIGQIDILRKMYGAVVVTPEVVREYGGQLPEWVSVQAAPDAAKTAMLNKFLGIGEASAIALAMQTAGAILIVDDKRARQFAHGLGLDITGTLGLLIRAYKNGIIQDIDSIVADLRKVGFRLPANAEAMIKTVKR